MAELMSPLLGDELTQIVTVAADPWPSLLHRNSNTLTDVTPDITITFIPERLSPGPTKRIRRSKNCEDDRATNPE
jgi:hypothetical protein